MEQEFSSKPHQEQAIPAVSQADTANIVEAQIEDYLDHVCAPLVETVPYSQRTAWRAEMKAHLEGMVAAYEELGASPQDAVREAIRQFGQANRIADQCRQEWETTHSTTTDSVQGAPRQALRIFGGATFLAMALVWMTGASINYSYAMPLQLLLLFGLPTLAGTIVGLRVPRRPVRSILKALALLAFPTVLGYQLWSHLQTFTDKTSAGLFFAIMHGVCWTVSGLLAVGMSGGLRWGYARLKRALR